MNNITRYLDKFNQELKYGDFVLFPNYNKVGIARITDSHLIIMAPRVKVITQESEFWVYSDQCIRLKIESIPDSIRDPIAKRFSLYYEKI